jgi:hypothetical protein
MSPHAPSSGLSVLRNRHCRFYLSARRAARGADRTRPAAHRSRRRRRAVFGDAGDAAESGVTAGWFGLVRAILLGGAATLVVTGAWARIFAVLSRMDRFPHHADK